MRVPDRGRCAVPRLEEGVLPVLHAARGATQMRRVIGILREQLSRDEVADALVILTICIVAVLMATGVLR